MLNPTTTDQAGLAKGDHVCCQTQETGSIEPWRLILLGAPGVGKGTQADLLKAQLGFSQLSTGEIFRAAQALPHSQQSPAMREAINRLREGLLVSDDLVIELFRDRASCLHHPKGILLDGFPRTVTQALALEDILEDEGLELDAAINYELPLDTVIQRIAGRRVCPQCKRSYHLTEFPPLRTGHCDKCNVPLFQREDDHPDAVRVRLHAYEKNTAPLIAFYEERDLLVRIECSGSPSAIFESTRHSLGIG